MGRTARGGPTSEKTADHELFQSVDEFEQNQLLAT